MLKIFVLITGIVLMLVQSSCVNSLQPVATSKTIITDKRVVGEWSDGKNVLRIQDLATSDILDGNENEKGKEKKVFLGENKEDSMFYTKAYAITIQQKGIDYIMVGSLSRIDDQLFIDIMSLGAKDPERPNQKGSGFEFSFDYLPTFSIAKIEFVNDNKITIKYLNGEYIKEQINKGNLRLKHEKDNLFGSFLITASSFELRQFLEKYGHDERLYYSEDTTVLNRKG
jgi:hypothetical protein